MRLNVALSTLLFVELLGGLHSDVCAQTTSVTVGPGTGSNLSGAVTLYGASPGTGSVVLTVANSGSAQTTATVPYATGNIVIDSALNVFTNKNDFSSSTASVILPNVATFSPSALGQVAYNTAQQDLVSQGNQSVGGSIPRVLSVTVPATADLICALKSDSTFGSECVNTGFDGTFPTVFQTAFTLPANFLLSGKRLVFTADFKVWNTTSPPTITVGLSLDSAGGVASLTIGNNGGSACSTGNAVTFSGGGTSLPAATANVAGGVITGYTVTSFGSGYTVPPTVTVAKGSCSTTPTATAVLTEYLYQSSALGQPAGAHTATGFSGSWALTGASAPSSSASTISNALGYNLPGSVAIGIANQVSQPPVGWSTNARHIVVFTIQYSANTAANAIQLQTLTVEELN